MLSPLPNQPLSFTPSRLQGCLCPEPEECLLVDTTDVFTTQFVYSPCLGEQLLSSPNFEDGADWYGPSWTIKPGRTCLEQGVGPYGSLQELSFTPIPFSFYRVIVTFADISSLSILGGLRITFAGGINQVIRSHGEYTWTVQSFSPQPLTFSSHLGGTGCVLQALVYELTPNLLVEALDEDDNMVAYMQWGVPTIGHFVFDEDRVTITFDTNDLLDVDGDPVQLLPGCYRIRITDQCDFSTYTSQCVRVGDYGDCTILLTACNAGNSIGFIGEFEPTMRVVAKLSRPAYEYEVAEERLSDGQINRYFADRRRTMKLAIDGLGERGHEFISTLPLWDHVYVGMEPYVVKAEAYEPAYADVYEARGGILLKVEPWRELVRKVRCAEDDTGGCAPPPNYLVQGTGPNEDYVLQSIDGERILLH